MLMPAKITENENLISAVAQAKFFSLLMDGSTDKGNADNEATLVVWCDPEDEKVCTKIGSTTLSDCRRAF